MKDILATFRTKDGSELCLFHLRQQGLTPEQADLIDQPADAVPIVQARSERLSAAEAEKKEKPLKTKPATEKRICARDGCGKGLRRKKDGTYDTLCMTCRNGCKPGYGVHGPTETTERTKRVYTRKATKKAKRPDGGATVVQTPARGPESVQVHVTERHLDQFWQGRSLQQKAELFSNFLASEGV